jgi:hypothetical protein
MPFKTFMKYEKGTLVHTELPQSDKPSDIIPIISVTGSIEMCIQMFVKPNIITGTIYIESKDRKLYLKYDIIPKEAIPAVEKAIDLFYRDRERLD